MCLAIEFADKQENEFVYSILQYVIHEHPDSS